MVIRLVLPPLLLALAGCELGVPVIEATSVLEDTASTQGPYLVDVVTLGVIDRHRVILSWAADGGDFIPVLMSDAGNQRWQAGIPGQPAGTTVHYYAAIFDGDQRLVTDPEGAGAAPYTFAITP